MSPRAVFPVEGVRPRSARTSTDALRSLKKYVAQALGPEWEVRLAWQEGVFSRPFCRVGFAGPELLTGAAHTIDVVQPFNVLCHPVEQPSSDASMLEVGRVSGLLTDAFRIGVQWDEPSDPSDPTSALVKVRGRPNRVPLWNWEGVPLDGSVAQRFERDYLRVVNLSVNVVEDPSEELLRAVACDLRLNWRRRGEILSGIPMQGVKVGLDPAP